MPELERAREKKEKCSYDEESRSGRTVGLCVVRGGFRETGWGLSTQDKSAQDTEFMQGV